MRWLPALLLLLVAQAAQAQWRFGPAVDVAAGGEGVFQHLDASGRRALAVSGDRLALTWEDNRDGGPRCYLALAEVAGGEFREQGFGQGECFEPALAALDPGRFALIWEDEGGVKVALVSRQGQVGQPLSLAPDGGHGSLAWHPQHGLYAAWSGSEQHRRRVWLARLAVAADDPPRLREVRPVDARPPLDDQLYPVLAVSGPGVTLAWEDRRLGHTVIYYSHAADGRIWTLPARLSHNPTGRVNDELGRGTGAMRPTLASMGDDRVAAVWLDKRDFLSGYDVYAALSGNHGASFGRDRKAQDSFGDAIAQWHAAAAGNARGDLAIAWDDERDGTADIWLTWLKAGGQFADVQFADNQTPAPASGPHAQSDPVIALDESGRLHLAWIERGEAGASRLRYAMGTPAGQP